MPASEPHERTLEAAERVRQAVEKNYLDMLFKMPPAPPVRQPSWPAPTPVPFPGDCGCPIYGTCMNVMCPRRVRTTFGTMA